MTRTHKQGSPSSPLRDGLGVRNIPRLALRTVSVRSIDASCEHFTAAEQGDCGDYPAAGCDYVVGEVDESAAGRF
jgi:hypothetical protein